MLPLIPNVRASPLLGDDGVRYHLHAGHILLPTRNPQCIVMSSQPPTIACTLLLLAIASASRADDVADASAVTTLFARHCNDCHGGDDPEAGLSLAKLDPTAFPGDDLETWRLVREQVRFGDMPPEGSDPLPEADRKRLLDWIRGEMLRTQEPGANSDEKLLLPQFGNYVDHLALFDVRRSHVTPAPPRIWRLRPSIYNTIAPQLGEGISGLANALSLEDGSEFKDFSASYFVDEAGAQQLLGNAKKIARAQLGPKSRDRVFKSLADPETPPSEETVRDAIETAFRKALGRGPREDERQRFAAFHARSAEIGGHEVAAEALLSAVLMQPEFVFRRELGDGEPDEHGRVRLSQREIAYALSYALSDRPVREFIEAANRGELDSKERIAELVATQLNDETASNGGNPRILEFFREYFHYPFANEVFKDQPEGGEHKSSALVADLELVVEEILERDHEVLAELLTTRRYYVNATYGRKENADRIVKRDGKTRKYQTAFNLPLDWKWGRHLQPVGFPRDERAGVLTHPAWLAAWSGNFENHPVQRGKWIRTHLLGGSVPDVPIGVDARVPEKEHTTFRDRLKLATSAAECWRCHRKMDPLGVPFERFDHYGRVQRLDAGQPVDTTGRIDRTDFPELHRDVSGPTELMEVLATSPRVEQVFVRHAFRFFMGRNETLGDANTLQDAHRAYHKSGGSFNALVASLLTSDSFLLRQADGSTTSTE